MNNSIKLPVAELKSALGGIAKVLPRHSTLPVLGMIRVERDREGHVDLSATDLDTFASLRLEGLSPTSNPAKLLVPFTELQKLGKSCPADEVLELEPISEDKLILRHRIGSQPVEQVITTPPVDDFPSMPEITTEPVDLDEAARVTLLNALDCASDDPTRLIIQGAYLDVSRASGHYFVATDGRHLFASNSINLAIASSVLIPDHRFITWGGFAKDGHWKLSVQAAGKKDSGYVKLESPHWSFITKQIDGNYPNWRQIVDDRQELTGTLEISDAAAEEMRRIVPRLPGAETPNHILGLTVYGSKLFLRGRSKDQDPWTEVEVPGVTITGDPATVYLNRHYLLKAINFGLRQIGVQEPLRPLRFHDGGSRQMIVMPVRVENAPVAPPRTPTEAPVSSTPAASTDSVEQPVASDANPNQQPEMKTPSMQNGNNGKGHSPTATDTTAAEKPGLEQALDQIESIKGSIRGAVTNLNALADTLRQVQRERRTSEREIRSVRDTLKTLQTVRL